MSIISQNNENEVAILDCVQRFFSSHKVGSLLKKCNDTKEKGVPAISLVRYMLLALEQRKSEDQRTLGELFFFLVDEMADITFTQSLCILMDALMASLQEIMKLSEEQLAAFTADFTSRLPQYLQNALDSRTTRA